MQVGDRAGQITAQMNIADLKTLLGLGDRVIFDRWEWFMYNNGSYLSLRFALSQTQHDATRLKLVDDTASYVPPICLNDIHENLGKVS